jgi:peptidoglycan/xylan/chitin deacetylase (PgdA/CDA1 family)
MRRSKKAVVLTFDDGYQNFFDYAYPVLRRYDFKATVYLVSGFLGGQATWFEDKRRDTPRLMDAERIRLLHREGIVFGSHGVSHARLSGIDPVKMEREVTISKARLEDLLQEEVSHFCYPYGDHNQLVADAVERAGYQSAVTCIRGATLEGSDPYLLPRKAVSFGDNILGFLWKIHVKNQPKKRG